MGSNSCCVESALPINHLALKNRSVCRKQKADEFVFVNPKTQKSYTDTKTAFATASKKAEIRDLERHGFTLTFASQCHVTLSDGILCHKAGLRHKPRHNLL